MYATMQGCVCAYAHYYAQENVTQVKYAESYTM